MSSSPAGVPKRIAIVAPTLAGVLRDRANLIHALTARGHSVLAVASSQLAGEVAALHHLGGEHRNFDPRPPGMALLAGRKVVQAVRDILSEWKADTVIVSGQDLAGRAASAARKAGAVRVITIVGGLGSGGDEDRRATAQSYRHAVKLSDAAVLHNAHDARLFSGALKLPDGFPVVVVTGDGVDIDAFTPSPLPDPTGSVTFVMIADPGQRQAIEAYVSAAREISARGVPARFELATDREMAEETAFLTAGGVVFLGRASDPNQVLANAHVAVHLAADDGAPAALKQALAAGRPVLTLDVPGCREAVDERVNGCLVPPNDGRALVAALESFLVHRDLLASEARAARAKAVQAYDRHKVLAPVVAAVEGS
ncbi:MAG: glycosyltransferase [Hyphomicrobium sp.]|nr:glycosyltransferase [Hyphomicrobium sp.]